MKVHSWDHDPHETPPKYRDHNTGSQNYRNQTSIPRDDRSYQTRKGSKSNGIRPSSDRSNYSKDPRFYDQNAVADRERTDFMLDYPDSFEIKAPSRNSSPKDRRQRLMTPYEDNENPMDDTSKNYRSSRCTSRNTRASNSAKSHNESRHWEEAQSSRIRSRTCSPPANRQKRTQSVIKSFQENVDQSEDQYDSCDFQDWKDISDAESANDRNSALSRSAEKLKKFVDRAVDKDSLSNLLNISANYLSHITQASAINKDKRRGGFGFWEFIPLDEDQKHAKVSGKIASLLRKKMYSGSKSYPQTKKLADDTEVNNRKSKSKIAQKGVAEQDSSRPTSGTSNIKSVDDSSAFSRPSSGKGTARNNRNPSDSSPLEQPTKSQGDSRETRTDSAGSRIPKYTEVSEKPGNQNQMKRSKNGSKVESTFGFSWSSKSGQYLKRPNSGKSDSNADKKKKTVDDDPPENSGDKKAEMSFVEKTASCLKRKLEKKVEETSPSRSPAMTTEKEIRSEGSKYSRLPIRIGSRFRSKNSTPTKAPDNKVQPISKEQSKTKLPEELNTQESSVRSRTKPKVKQTVEQINVVEDSTPATADPVSAENVHVTSAKDSYQNSKTENSKSANTAEGRLTDHISKEKSSWKTRLSRNEKLGINTEDLKILNVEQDQRKRELSRSCGKEANRRSNLLKESNVAARNDFKEKCLFQLTDEDIICNSYCNKDCKNMGSCRSRKSITIKSRQ